MHRKFPVNVCKNTFAGEYLVQSIGPCIMTTTKKGLLERLAEGPVIGDGSICCTLEKRGYCKCGPWTPEAVVEYPEAVKNLQREYLRAGADVMQTATFYANDGKLSFGSGKKKLSFTVSY